MTNTRLTDPEILEFRYPVVLEDFHIRKGSGGKGKWHAGDGIRRTIRFLREDGMHDAVRPSPRAAIRTGGRRRRSGRRELGAPQGWPMEKLEGCDATVIDAGEAIIIQTPTAGGYGKPG